MTLPGLSESNLTVWGLSGANLTIWGLSGANLAVCEVNLILPELSEVDLTVHIRVLIADLLGRDVTALVTQLRVSEKASKILHFEPQAKLKIN